MLTSLALPACLASTLFMTGVIVFVQVVHYPLFGRVEAGSFPAYHSEHIRLTTYVVLPPMLVELLTSLALVARPPEGSGTWLAWTGLGAAVVTWVATGAVSVPLHDRLARGFDRQVHRSLVATNSVRLAAWVAHSGVLLVMAARAMR